MAQTSVDPELLDKPYEAKIGASASVKRGSFDLLRLIAALAVLWSHQFALLDLPEPSFMGFGASQIALDTFFAISGYLNVASIMRSRSGWRFLVRRGLRIYPALIGAAVFCAAVGLIFSTNRLGFLEKLPTFLWKNSTMLFGIQYNMPGVFEANPFPNAINGSLWTLPIEIKLYIYLAVLSFLTRYNSKLLLFSTLAIAGCLIVASLLWPDAQAYSRRFAIIFCVGGVVALTERAGGWVFIAAMLIPAVLLAAIDQAVAYLLAAPIIILFVAKLEMPRIQPPIDISYGVYLYAFPIQQLIAQYRLGLWLSLALAVSATAGIAIASAIWIERPIINAARRRPRTSPIVPLQP